MPELRAMNLPMKEALAYWGDKVSVTREQFDELTGNVRARAFTVARVTSHDMLDRLRDSLGKALAEGQSFQKWAKAVAADANEAGLGKARLETIFRNNVQSAYSAGRYAQMMRVAKQRPFWRYVAVGDARTRPTHRAMHGMVFRYDDPFWQENSPPNGHLCRCTTQTLSARQMERRGLKVETEMPAVTPADPGWQQNIGRDYLAGLTPSEFEGKLRDLADKALCREGRGLFAGTDYCKPALATIDERHVLPVEADDLLPESGWTDEQYVLAFLREFGLRDLNASKVVTLPGGMPVVISKEFFIDRKKGGWKVRKEGRHPYLKLLARTILNPYEIWEVPVGVSGKRLRSLRLIRLFQGPKKKIGGFVVFDLIGGRQWRGTTIYPPKIHARQKAMLDYLEDQRRGVLVYREE